VVDPLAPVETGEGENPAAPAGRCEVDSEIAEEILSSGGDLELAAGGDQGAALDEGRGETDADPAGEVVVASSRGADGSSDFRLAVGAGALCGARAASASRAWTVSGRVRR
jgi:hypothetical protein